MATSTMKKQIKKSTQRKGTAKAAKKKAVHKGNVENVEADDKQSYFDGMDPPKIPDLDKAIERYVAAKRIQAAKNLEMTELKTVTIPALVHEAKITGMYVHEYKGRQYRVVVEEKEACSIQLIPAAETLRA